MVIESNIQKTIIIVEDEAFIGSMIKNRLLKEKYICHYCPGADELFEMLEHIEPDLLLLDYLLGDYSVETLLDKLVSRNLKIPFIVVTGQNDIALAIKMMQRGALDYIQKSQDFISILPEQIKRTFAIIEMQKTIVASQKELELREKKYRNIFNNFQDVYLEIQLDGKILEVSPSVIRVLKIKPEMLINKNISIFNIKTLTWQNICNNLKRKNSAQTRLLLNNPSDGTPFYGEFAFLLVKGDENHDDYIAASLRDITERYQMQEEIIQSKKQYQTLFNQLPLGVFIIQDNMVVFHNTIAKQMLGEKKIIGSPASDVFPFKLNLNSRNKSIENRAVFEELITRYYTILKKGIIFQKKDSIMVVLTDITEFKTMENNMLSKIIDAEDGERKRIAEDIHDGLGPLLSGLKLYISSLERQLSDDRMSDSEVEIFATVKELLDQAISDARAISNNLTPNVLQNYGLISAINMFIEKLPNTEKQKITLETNLKTRISEKMSTQCYRIITEILNNAVKHARASKVLLNIFDNAQNIYIKYNDDGVGFTTKKELPETHHGLRNLRSRVNLLNGNINIDSNPDQGVHIEIAIPLKN